MNYILPMTKKSQLGICLASLLSTPCFSYYSPQFNFDTEMLSSEVYKQALLSAGVTFPIMQNDTGIAFSDMRLSRTSDDIDGIHLGLGARTSVKNFTLGINGFYDKYNTKNSLSQFVGGIELLHDKFHIVGNFYNPQNNDLAFKGFDAEAAIKFKGVLFGAKKYKLSNELDHELDGIGINARYERYKGGSGVYASIGYQYDDVFEDQWHFSLGLSIAATSKKEANAQSLPRLQRSLRLYGYTPNLNSSNNIVVNSDDNIHQIINSAPAGATIIVKDNLLLTEGIKLKPQQQLIGKGYFNHNANTVENVDESKLVKIKFQNPETNDHLIEISSYNTVRGFYLDDSNSIAESGNSDSIQIISPGSFNIIENNMFVNNLTLNTPIIFTSNNTSNIIKNNIISTLDSSGIVFYGNCSDNQIVNNKINSGYSAIKFTETTSNNRVINNFIVSNSNSGAIYFNSSTNDIISGNIITQTHPEGSGINFSHATTTNITNNTLECTHTCISSAELSSGNISNNKLTNPTSHGIYLENTSNTVINSNIIISSLSPNHSFSAIFVKSGGGNNLITGNNITLNNVSNANFSYGIDAIDLNNSIINNNEISNIGENSTILIRIFKSQNTIISGNIATVGGTKSKFINFAGGSTDLEVKENHIHVKDNKDDGSDTYNKVIAFNSESYSIKDNSIDNHVTLERVSPSTNTKQNLLISADDIKFTVPLPKALDIQNTVCDVSSNSTLTGSNIEFWVAIDGSENETQFFCPQKP